MGETRVDGIGSRAIEDSTWAWQEDMVNKFKELMIAWPQITEPKTDTRRIELRSIKAGDFKKLREALADDGVIMTIPKSELNHCPQCNYEYKEIRTHCPECQKERPATFWRIAGQV